MIANVDHLYYLRPDKCPHLILSNFLKKTPSDAKLVSSMKIFDLGRDEF